jgi:hypothetical protein
MQQGAYWEQGIVQLILRRCTQATARRTGQAVQITPHWHKRTVLQTTTQTKQRFVDY